MKTFSSLAGGVIVCAVALVNGAAAEPGEPGGWPLELPTIVGTWQVEVTVRYDAPDCRTAQPLESLPNPFPSLNTFHQGGTVSETGSRSPPSRRGPGHGVWQRTGGRAFDARYTFQSYDPNGFLATNMDIRSSLTLSRDGDAFSGVSRFAFSDVSGNTLPFCATLQGVRYTL